MNLPPNVLVAEIHFKPGSLAPPCDCNLTPRFGLLECLASHPSIWLAETETHFDYARWSSTAPLSFDD